LSFPSRQAVSCQTTISASSYPHFTPNFEVGFTLRRADVTCTACVCCRCSERLRANHLHLIVGSPSQLNLRATSHPLILPHPPSDLLSRHLHTREPTHHTPRTSARTRSTWVTSGPPTVTRSSSCSWSSKSKSTATPSQPLGRSSTVSDQWYRSKFATQTS
jgi:hypothetical protein